MSTTYTPNLKLGTPAVSDRTWNAPLDANRLILDSLAPIGGLAVTQHEIPSTSLNISVSAGSFQAANGSVVAYAGTSSFAVTTAIVNYLWLTDAGTLTLGTAWPTAAPVVRLATIDAGASTITSITDARVTARSVGPGPYVIESGSAPRSGVVTLVAGTSTVSTTAVASNSRIFLTAQTSAGTPGFLGVSARTPGTSFTITSSSGSDTSVVAWQIVTPA